MTVIHNDTSDTHYSITPNALINDQRLAMDTRLLLIWCLSKPKEWHFHLNHIKKTFSIGDERLYRMLNELIKWGYCQRVQERVGSKFGSVDYQIYRSPLPVPSDKIKIILPQPGFPDAGAPDAGNSALVSTDLLVNTERKREREEAAPPPPKDLKTEEPERKAYGEHVRLSDAEYQELLLIARGSSDLLEAKIINMNTSESGKPVYRRYKRPNSHFTQLKSWLLQHRSDRDSRAKWGCPASNALYAEELVEKYRGKGKLHLSVTDELISIAHCELPKTLKNIKFKEGNFRETVDSYVKKILEMK